jgi:probable rRNA maturation factor
MIKINVITNNRSWFSLIKDPNQYIDRKVKKINLKKKEFKKKIIYCTLLLSGNQEIKKLNKKFRKKNKSTDILSFPLEEKIKISKNTYLGDIIISYNYLNKPRSQDLKLFKEKVIKIFIHGFLHLLGFDHKKNNDYSKMLREENFLFKSVKSKIN